jgi:hypothetical protein
MEGTQHGLLYTLFAIHPAIVRQNVSEKSTAEQFHDALTVGL